MNRKECNDQQSKGLAFTTLMGIDKVQRKENEVQPEKDLLLNTVYAHS